MTEQLGAVILGGGRSSRMGVDKAILDWDGRRAVDIVYGLAQQAGCDKIIVAGRDYGYPWIADPSVDCGPAVAIMAAIDSMPETTRILVLPIDAPTLLLTDVSLLLTELGPGAAFAGQPVPMQIERSAAQNARGATSLRAIVEAASLRIVPMPTGAYERVRGANTPDELRTLRSLQTSHCVALSRGEHAFG